MKGSGLCGDQRFVCCSWLQVHFLHSSIAILRRISQQVGGTMRKAAAVVMEPRVMALSAWILAKGYTAEAQRMRKWRELSGTAFPTRLCHRTTSRKRRH